MKHTHLISPLDTNGSVNKRMYRKLCCNANIEVKLNTLNDWPLYVQKNKRNIFQAEVKMALYNLYFQI